MTKTQQIEMLFDANEKPTHTQLLYVKKRQRKNQPTT